MQDGKAISEYWENKKAKIEILKDGKRLIYTALILKIDNHSITFLDKFGKTFCFNRELVKEMEEVL